MSSTSTRIGAWALAGVLLVAYAVAAAQPGTTAWAYGAEVALVALVGLAFPVAAAVAAHHAPRGNRSIWLALLATGLCAAAGQALRVLGATIPGGAGSLYAAADYAFLASYAAMFVLAAGMSRRRTMSGLTRLRYGLDVTAVFIAIGVVGYLTMTPTVGSPSPLDTRATVFAFVFAALDILLLVVIAVVALGSRGAVWHRWELLLMAAVVAVATGDILVMRSLLVLDASWALESLTGLSVFVPTTLATLAAVHYATESAHVSEAPSLVRGPASRVPDLVLPALSVAIVPYVALSATGGGGLSTPVVAIAAIAVLSLLLVSRSAIQTLENANLVKATLNDPLTSLYNARMYHERLAEEIARSERTGEPLCIANIDIDEFAKINNLYGHEAGDQCIRHIAEQLRRSVRAFDTVCRVGGDEFGVIMPGTTPESARGVCVRFQQALESDDSPCVGPVRLSIGIASYPGQASDAETLVRRADGAMYWVKYHGRNGTMVYESELIDSLDASARARRNEETARLQAVEALAAAADARDPYTRNHSKNVAALAVRFGEELALEPQMIAKLETAALLHDVGTIGTPDHILRAVGRLTPEERLQVQEHAGLSERIVSSAHPGEIAQWAAAHHERWDGTGYPRGLSGTDIPLGARILAVCDAFDSMTSDRSYRCKRSRREAVRELVASAGTQFDPSLVPVFCRSVNASPGRARAREDADAASEAPVA